MPVVRVMLYPDWLQQSRQLIAATYVKPGKTRRTAWLNLVQITNPHKHEDEFFLIHED